MPPHPVKPPAFVLGGSANALSVVRSLSPLGVPTGAIARVGASVLSSRHCGTRIDVPETEDVQAAFRRHLLEEPTVPGGSVLLPCDDDAVEFLAQNADALGGRYLLDGTDPEVQLGMLDKRRSMALASAAGIHVPGSYLLESQDDVERALDALRFPLLLKPIHSHRFQAVFGTGGRKYFRAPNEDALRAHLTTCLEHDIAVMATEEIPGPDTALGSYYTILDGAGEPLFHFTKKIVRRFPKNEGLACYHKTEWDEEIAAEGLKFFQGIGYRGLGNVEFKRDPRDGRLVFIECNPRFTSAQVLLARAGIDAAQMLYAYVTGTRVPGTEPPRTYRQQLHYWWPLRDVRAYLELRKLGELSFGAWLKGLARPQVLPFFSFTDPLPSMRRAWRKARKSRRP